MTKNGLVKMSNGDKHWYQNGKLHREDGPAIEEKTGAQYWFKEGKLHRSNGPAVIRTNGEMKWYTEGIELNTQKQTEKNQKKTQNAKNKNKNPKNGLIINDNGDKLWYQNDKLHRFDGPAIETHDGMKYWYLSGKELTEEKWHEIYTKKTVLSIAINKDTDKEIINQLDGLVIDINGEERWYQKGKLHNENGPAFIAVNGDKHWFINGKLHRLDGPAVEEASGCQYWFANGRLHNETGPAVIRANESKWYLHGVQATVEGVEKIHLEKILSTPVPSHKKLKI
jgi:hypothetical protein